MCRENCGGDPSASSRSSRVALTLFAMQIHHLSDTALFGRSIALDENGLTLLPNDFRTARPFSIIADVPAGTQKATLVNALHRKGLFDPGIAVALNSMWKFANVFEETHREAGRLLNVFVADIVDGD